MTSSQDIFAAPAGPVSAPTPLRRPRTAGSQAAPAAAGRQRLDVPLLFVVAYVGFQVSLLFLGSTPLRAPLRIGAFTSSLGLAVLVWPGRNRHPVVRLLPLLALALVPGLFLSGQPSIVAALAQATLYLSTLSPLLWVSHRPMSQKSFRRILLLLWGFNTLSAGVGVLQIYFPGQFQSQLSSVIAERGAAFVGSLTVTLADGSHALRPMGLTDSPGGAASGGLFAITYGVGILFTERRWAMRALALIGMVIGLFVIFLTHVRVSFAMAAIGVCVMGVAFARRGDVRRASTLLAVAVAVAVVGTIWAFAIGGEETVERFASLTDARAGETISQNRGAFIQDAFTKQLFDYPLGAGLGRWGMISYYFGGDAGRDGLWAEVMWSAWIYDGGIPLLSLYCVAIGLTVFAAWRVAVTRGGSGYVAVWGAVVLAYDVAAVAATFDAPIFATQAGVELWFLNACLFNAWRTSTATREGRPEGRLEGRPADDGPAIDRDRPAAEAVAPAVLPSVN